jgi:NADH:ubiquinone oxidoreductase subunit D
MKTASTTASPVLPVVLPVGTTMCVRIILTISTTRSTSNEITMVRPATPWTVTMIHIKEMYQSLNIIEQLIDNIPEGDFYIKQKPIIKVPEGQWWFSVEGAAAGEFGVYLDSRGDKSPYRVKLRPMGLTLAGALRQDVAGQKIADLITTGAAIDFVIPLIDKKSDR